jgi:hypothetical protein
MTIQITSDKYSVKWLKNYDEILAIYVMEDDMIYATVFYHYKYSLDYLDRYSCYFNGILQNCTSICILVGTAIMSCFFL